MPTTRLGFAGPSADYLGFQAKSAALIVSGLADLAMQCRSDDYVLQPNAGDYVVEALADDSSGVPS